MTHEKTRRLALTALLLALCLCFQLLKSISTYITGSLVNLVLIIAALSCGWQSGAAISCIAPLLAYLIGATPIINMLPVMLPVIMVGNCLISLSALLWKDRRLPIGLLLGSLAKAGWLWGMVWFVVLPLFGANVPEKLAAAAKVSFSVTQLITALLGSALASVIWPLLQKVWKASE